MGTDIHGWVEIANTQWSTWNGVIKIDHLLYRSYGMFSSLFGIRNFGEFEPIAADRGTPPDPSNEFMGEVDGYGGGIGVTWITWGEMAGINWDEEEDAAAVQNNEYPPRRRKDHLVGGWLILYKIMGVLAEQAGPENVRLSVWFDQL